MRSSSAHTSDIRPEIINRPCIERLPASPKFLNSLITLIRGVVLPWRAELALIMSSLCLGKAEVGAQRGCEKFCAEFDADLTCKGIRFMSSNCSLCELSEDRDLSIASTDLNGEKNADKICKVKRLNIPMMISKKSYTGRIWMRRAADATSAGLGLQPYAHHLLSSRYSVKHGVANQANCEPFNLKRVTRLHR